MMHLAGKSKQKRADRGGGAIAGNRLVILANEIRGAHAECAATFRRALSDAYNIGQKLLEAKGLIGDGNFTEWIREDCGISDRQARKYMQITKNYPDQNGLGADLTINGILKGLSAQPKGRARAEREAIPQDLPSASEHYTLIHGDMSEVYVEPESIDCIITDPPYPEEFIGLYAELAYQANLWLKPGGSLLAMAGQYHLPAVLDALQAGELSYQWTLAYLTPGGQAVQIFPRRVNTFWKPVFWFIKGAYAGSWVGDVAKSEVNDNDKRFHDWGQSESGMADLVRRFSKPGDTICDPFMGGGATAAASIAANRYFVGIEKDAAAFAMARHRIAQIGDAA